MCRLPAVPGRGFCDGCGARRCIHQSELNWLHSDRSAPVPEPPGRDHPGALSIEHRVVGGKHQRTSQSPARLAGVRTNSASRRSASASSARSAGSRCARRSTTPRGARSPSVRQRCRYPEEVAPSPFEGPGRERSRPSVEGSSPTRGRTPQRDRPQEPAPPVAPRSDPGVASKTHILHKASCRGVTVIPLVVPEQQEAGSSTEEEAKVVGYGLRITPGPKHPP